MRFLHMPIRMAKIQNTDNTKCCQGCEARGSLILCRRECKMGQPFQKTVQQFLTKRNILLPYDLGVKVLVIQSCLTLCDPMDCSPPGSSVRGDSQARILSGLPFPYSYDQRVMLKREFESYVHTKTRTWPFKAAAFIIVKTRKQYRCSSVGDKIKNMVHSDNVISFSFKTQ